jgi:restriction endonuclease S subunit
MKVKLSDIATVKAGHAFRGKIPELSSGNGYVIQQRDINENGIINWTGLVRTEVTGRREPDWLQPGDIIFSARGVKNIASCIDEIEKPVVCGPYYFLIHINLNVSAACLPAFIAWQLNQKNAQRTFAQTLEGTIQVSIRKSVLENIELDIPDIKKQHAIAELDKLTKKEQGILEALIDNRKQQMRSIASGLLNNTIELNTK